MPQTITIRLTPHRERMLNRVKKRYNLRKNSDAIELALTMVSGDDVKYRSRIEKVAGCIRPGKRGDAVTAIRGLRDST